MSNTTSNPLIDYRPRSVTDLLDVAQTIIEAIDEYGAADSEIPAVTR